MTNELIRRLEALERRMNAELRSGTLPPGGPLQVVIITGCLPPGEPIFANAGSNQWLRLPDESIEDFSDRAARGAREAGEVLLVVGGLPMSEAQNEAALAAYDAWLLTDDGVPPVETRAPARSRLGFVD
jgi:hypothetical protein